MFYLQLCWLTPWTRHMTEICQLVHWLCHEWVTLFKYVCVLSQLMTQRVCLIDVHKFKFTHCHMAVCRQHFIPRRSGSSRVLPLQVWFFFFLMNFWICSVFVSISVSYVPHFRGFAWCPLLCFSWNELCLACLFGLSVLVYFQSHGLLCSGATPDFSCLPLLLESAPFLWLQASVFLWTHLLLWWSQRFRNKISPFDIITFLIIILMHSI